ncbi:hypothetical protein CTI12_AA116050 [Artemisia annua]|uniref:RRM domain-containing protein n=1 Tax=Artemisia annua TaxID=35608 RepID=A0A2U1PT96_ARTAN|nr:hypothetical protein CTI12_AA116050 [Artemisia annua]
MCAKDLWHTCKQYGQVVDAYIPNRRSKAGKRFGFVRFIKVFDVERLVNNLCTVWVGSHKLHANLPRFQRGPLNKHSNSHNDNGVKRGNLGDAHNNNVVKSTSNSYVNVVKGSQYSKEDMVSTPALVLDDSCLNLKDYSLCLFGKVKDFTSLSNLKVVLVNEGFCNIKIKYMGGYWVMMEFQSEEAKNSFQINTVMGTWFSQIQQASCDFTTDERVIWVEIEGIPIKMWSENTFNRIASKWGVLLDVDDQEDKYFHSKRICINTKITTNVFESFKTIYRGKVVWVRAKEVPGWVPNFVEGYEEESDSDVDSEVEPNAGDSNNVEDLEGDSDVDAVPETKFEEEQYKHNSEEDSVGQKVMQSEDPFNLYDLLKKSDK